MYLEKFASLPRSLPLSAHCGLKGPLLSESQRLPSDSHQCSPPSPFCVSSSHAVTVPMSESPRHTAVLVSYVSFQAREHSAFTPKQLLLRRGDLGSGARGREVPQLRKSCEAKGGQREVGGRWRGWKAPEGAGVDTGPRRSPVAATFQSSIPRPQSGAAPAHTSRCAFPALNHSPATGSLH